MKLVLYHRKRLEEMPDTYFSSTQCKDENISGSTFHIHERLVEANISGQLLIIHANDVKELKESGGVRLSTIEDHAVSEFGEFIGTVFVTTERGHGVYRKSKLQDHEIPVLYWNSIDNLIAYIRGSKASITLESILEVMSNENPPMTTLTTLAFLCTGFLATHAEHDGYDEHGVDKDIALALEKMGWWQLIESPDMAHLAEALHGKYLAVKDVIYWRQPVLTHVQMSTGKTNMKEALIERIQIECRSDSVPPKILKLVQSICESATHSLADVRLVARAYLSLAEELEKRIS